MTGSTCTASSVYSVSYKCEKALTILGGQWVSNAEQGAWIKIQLTQVYYISKITVSGRCDYSAQPQSVTLTFDDASTQTVCFSLHILVKVVNAILGQRGIMYYGSCMFSWGGHC